MTHGDDDKTETPLTRTTFRQSGRPKQVNVVLAADARFRWPLEAALASIRKNLDPQYTLRIFLLTSDLSEADVRWSCRHGDDSLKIVRPGIDVADVLPLRHGDHVSEATYYRLYMATAVDADVSRVVYLDSDLIVTGDLALLAQLDLQGKAVGAVRAFSIPTLGHGCIPLRANYADAQKPYFNAGVLLIDIDAWKQRRVRERALQFLRQNAASIDYWDQDALNGVLVDDWLELDPRWNRTSDYWQLGRLGRLPFSDSTVSSLREPYITHFASGTKPWTHYRHPDKRVYDKYLQLAGCRERRLTLLAALQRRLTGRFNALRGVENAGKRRKTESQ